MPKKSNSARDLAYQTHPELKFRRLRQAIIWSQSAFFALFVIGLSINIHNLGLRQLTLSEHQVRDSKTYQEFQRTAAEVNDFQARQSRQANQVVSNSLLDSRLSGILIEIQIGKLSTAKHHLNDLNRDINIYQNRLTETNLNSPANPPDASLDVPILLYHHAIPDFSAQMDALQQKDYNTITLDDLSDALVTGRALPPKPVVITFDDGYSDQLGMAADLERRRMKATFYIITGGEISQYCMGLNRRRNDCGEDFLTWDNLKQLEGTGLFTIGSHSVDHIELAKQPPEVQRFEIFNSKQELEAGLGHPIRHFCYPYGSFNQTTIDLTREAGYVTATTTLPGTIQTPGTLFTLKRVRATYDLP